MIGLGFLEIPIQSLRPNTNRAPSANPEIHVVIPEPDCFLSALACVNLHNKKTLPRLLILDLAIAITNAPFPLLVGWASPTGIDAFPAPNMQVDRRKNATESGTSGDSGRRKMRSEGSLSHCPS